jgi:ATP-dependent exoDNAse (exonuclease V) beta subunit
MEQLRNKLIQPFSDLSFIEGEHKYFVKQVPLKTSVSGLIKKFYKQTDFNVIAPFSARKAGVTTAEILKMWADNNQESRDRGHRVHSFGELYQDDRSLTPSCPQEEAIVKFWKELPEHIIPVASELRMYHFEHLFAGTADIILFDTKTQSYIIADYKTNKDLYKNFQGQTMLAPFEFLLDNPLSHYQLQLSYYQLLLEQIGITVTKRVIIWLKLDGTYELINTMDLTENLKATLI